MLSDLAHSAEIFVFSIETENCQVHELHLQHPAHPHPHDIQKQNLQQN